VEEERSDIWLELGVLEKLRISNSFKMKIIMEIWMANKVRHIGRQRKFPIPITSVPLLDIRHGCPLAFVQSSIAIVSKQIANFVLLLLLWW